MVSHCSWQSEQQQQHWFRTYIVCTGSIFDYGSFDPCSLWAKIYHYHMRWGALTKKPGFSNMTNFWWSCTSSTRSKVGFADPSERVVQKQNITYTYQSGSARKTNGLKFDFIFCIDDFVAKITQTSNSAKLFRDCWGSCSYQNRKILALSNFWFWSIEAPYLNTVTRRNHGASFTTANSGRCNATPQAAADIFWFW